LQSQIHNPNHTSQYRHQQHDIHRVKSNIVNKHNANRKKYGNNIENLYNGKVENQEDMEIMNAKSNNQLIFLKSTNEIKMLPDENSMKYITQEQQPLQSSQLSNQSCEIHTSRGQISSSISNIYTAGNNGRGNEEYSVQHKNETLLQQSQHASIVTQQEFLKNNVSHNFVFSESVSQPESKLMSMLNLDEENNEHISNRNSCDKSLNINYSMYPNHVSIKPQYSSSTCSNSLSNNINECTSEHNLSYNNQMFSNDHRNIFISHPIHAYKPDELNSATHLVLISNQQEINKYHSLDGSLATPCYNSGSQIIIDNDSVNMENINNNKEVQGEIYNNNNQCSNLNINRVYIEANVSYEIINENNQNFVNVPPRLSSGSFTNERTSTSSNQVLNCASKNSENDININNVEMDNIDLIINDGLSTNIEPQITQSNGTNEILNTSAIKSNYMTLPSTSSKKLKYSSEFSTNARDKRRKDRRERRQARTRSGQSLSQTSTGTNSLNRNDAEIISDNLNSNNTNSLPPPYSAISLSLPTVPSVVSTVPVIENSRYSFSLPMIRR
jgi:hypothetical protein